MSKWFRADRPALLPLISSQAHSGLVWLVPTPNLTLKLFTQQHITESDESHGVGGPPHSVLRLPETFKTGHL